MLIRCPTCASGYDLPATVLSGSRILRCAHCRDAWVHRGTPSDGTPAGLAIAAEVRAGRQALPASPLPRPRPDRSRRGSPKAGGSLAAAALLFATASAGMAAVGQRERVVAAFRPSAAVFAAFGLPVNLRGLALADVRSSLGSAEGAPALTLDGTIVNLRPQSTAVPAIRIVVRDAADHDLYTWTAPAPKGRLAAGETVPFHSRLSAPPRDGETLAVTFADAPPAPRHLAQASP